MTMLTSIGARFFDRMSDSPFSSYPKQVWNSPNGVWYNSGGDLLAKRPFPSGPVGLLRISLSTGNTLLIQGAKNHYLEDSEGARVNLSHVTVHQCTVCAEKYFGRPHP